MLCCNLCLWAEDSSPDPADATHPNNANNVDEGKKNETEVIDTPLVYEKTPSLGNEISPRVDEGWAFVKTRQTDEALKVADECIGKFNALFDKVQTQLAFQIDADYQEYVKTHAESFQRVDWAYKEALQLKAYVYAGNREFDEALKVIALIEKVAPVSSGTKTEKGFILSSQKKFDESLEVYQEAFAICEQYRSQAVYKAMSLRGMGFVLIELKQLEEAERFFKQSLDIEPGNETALNELRYIAGLRAAQKKEEDGEKADDK